LVTPPKETKTIPAADTVRAQSRGRRLPGAALPACLREAGDNKEYEGSQKSGHQDMFCMVPAWPLSQRFRRVKTTTRPRAIST
jgi:hypothetical protein